MIFIVITHTKRGPNEIVIGAILPLTGDGAMYGEWTKKGIDLAINEENQKGGINGKKIKILYEDTQQKPDLGVAAFKKLILIEKVQAVIGELSSSVTLAVAPVANQNKIVLLSPAASSPKITDAGDYIFRVCASDIFEGKVMAEFSMNKLKYKKVSILYINNEYGLGIKNVFNSVYIENGGEIVSIESFDQGTSDFRTQLLKIKVTNPQAIYLVGYAPEMAIALRQIKELRIKVPILSSYEAENPKILEVSGNAAEGIIYSAYDYDPKKENLLVQSFVKEYKINYGEEPNIVAALGYDSAKIMIEALKEARVISGDEIKNSLYNIKKYPGVTGITSFDRNGDVEKSVIIKTIKNKEFIEFHYE
jgi:branched-chain amino acid transport system substrate-binding protein